MKHLAKKILDFQERIRNYVRKSIDRLSEKEIEKVEREYQLLYQESLNDKEILNIKKKVVIRYSKFLTIILLLLILIFSAI